MNELIGKTCRIEFTLPRHCWPIAAWPALAIIEAVDMPMVKMRNTFGAPPIWVNVAIIQTIEESHA